MDKLIGLDMGISYPYSTHGHLYQYILVLVCGVALFTFIGLSLPDGKFTFTTPTPLNREVFDT